MNLEQKLKTYVVKVRKELAKLAAERDREIVRLRDQGMTLQAIGNKFGISRQRVERILHREKGKK